MAEYIERQAVIDLLKGAGEESGSPVVDIELMIEVVQDDISAADAAPIIHAKWEMRRVYVNGCEDSVEIVRCKDCKHSRNLDRTDPYENSFIDGCLWCRIGRGDGVSPEQFCDDGERIQENENG